jgi:hypothetical protein
LARLAPSRSVAYAFLASRLALFAVGLMTQTFLEPFSTHVSPLHLTDSAALRVWGQWDAEWYVNLASHGYADHPRADGQVNWVFFPAYPLLGAALARLTHLPVFIALVALSNLCFLAALSLVHRFARDEFDPRTADLAVALLCATPGSYIFSSAYTESLFLLAIAACLLLLRAQRWLAAGGAAALAVLTRNLGLGLVLPFAFAAGPRLWALLGEARPQRRRLVEVLGMAAGIALPFLALAVFCLFLYIKCGDPLAFISAQKAWGRHIGDPLYEPIRPFIERGAYSQYNIMSLAYCWAAFGMLAALALMRRWSLLALGCFLVLVPLSVGAFSFARYELVNLPLFLAGARLLSPRPQAALAILIALSLLNGFMMVAWTLAMPMTA